MRRSAATLLPLLLTCAAPAAGAEPIFDPARLGWAKVELEASKFFITARSAVDVGSFPSAQAKVELLAPKDGDALAPRGPDSALIAIHTTFLSQDSKVRFWFEPTDARALQRSELSISKKRHRHKTYRYGRRGVTAHTRTPEDGQQDLPHEKWTSVDERFVAFPESANGSVVTEPAALLYAVPAAALEAPGDRLELHVYSRGQVTAVDVAVEAKERIDVDYLEVSAEGERPVSGEVETLRVALRPRPSANGSTDGGIELLGLQGDIDLYLEPKSRAPLRVTGKIKIAGGVRLKATRVVLAAGR